MHRGACGCSQQLADHAYLVGRARPVYFNFPGNSPALLSQPEMLLSPACVLIDSDMEDTLFAWRISGQVMTVSMVQWEDCCAKR